MAKESLGGIFVTADLIDEQLRSPYEMPMDTLVRKSFPIYLSLILCTRWVERIFSLCFSEVLVLGGK
jgi:hypothetical protein